MHQQPQKPYVSRGNGIEHSGTLAVHMTCLQLHRSDLEDTFSSYTQAKRHNPDFP